MTSILGHEIAKTYRKWRTYIGFIAIGVVVPLVEIAMKLEGGSMVRQMTRGLEADFFFVGNLFNAYFVTYFIMNALWLHIPFLISLVAGDELAGEATGGTFRILLTRPASRTCILFAKYCTTLFYTATLVLFLGVLCIGIGIALFGTGDLLVPGKMLMIVPKAGVPWRLAFAFGLAIWSMWCVASLAFLLSSLVENAIGPIIGTMAVVIVCLVISNVPVAMFESIRPYLFTTYTGVWTRAMEDPVPWQEIGSSIGILGVFIVGFYIITWYIFLKKDILS